MLAELLTRTRTFAPYESREDMTSKLMGEAPLPWEDTGSESYAHTMRSLRRLKRSVLACLDRDPAVRPTAREVLGRWHGLLDDETSTAPRGRRSSGMRRSGSGGDSSGARQSGVIHMSAAMPSAPQELEDSAHDGTAAAQLQLTDVSSAGDDARGVTSNNSDSAAPVRGQPTSAD